MPTPPTKLREITITTNDDGEGGVWDAIIASPGMTFNQMVDTLSSTLAEVAMTSLTPEGLAKPEVVVVARRLLHEFLDSALNHALSHKNVASSIGVEDDKASVSIDPIAFLRARGISTNPEDHRRGIGGQ